MRVWLVVLIATLIAGCRSSREPRAAVGKGTVAAKTNAVAQPKPSVRPVNAVRGRVTSVRDDLRFVIADFTGAKLPALGQMLTVYRLDQKVAELRVSGPYRGPTVAADITVGDARPGDLVRDR